MVSLTFTPRARCAVVFLALLSVAAAAWAPARADDFVIGYLELKKDSRYDKKATYARYLTQPLGRPFPGAEVALKEVKFHGAELGIDFKLERERGRDAQELLAAIDELSGGGTHFFLIDAPADIVAELAAATSNRGIMLLNVAAREDALRQAQCRAHLFHVIPSYAMMMDALAQHLVSRKWTKALLLEGPLPDDKLLTSAFERATKRYGVKIVDKRPFVLSNDPRERDKNNVALLTGGADYDVVFVADSQGEFARDVPYQTVQARPVVGAEGLAAAAWHWSWDRHGAPQLEKRFEKKAKRPMRSVDWASWMAVKAIAEAVQRIKSTDFAKVREYLRSTEAVIDGFKGNRLNFRSWNNQLRQPMLLVTHNWVVERAPIKGFLHATNNLDTLGFDERESKCEF